jgi:hypothetical protein
MKFCLLAAVVLAVPGWGMPLTVKSITPGQGREVLPFSALPIAGFQPIMALSLTNAQSNDDFVWSPIRATSRVGQVMPIGQPEHIAFATLDSGAQVSIVSGIDADTFDFFGANRDGINEIELGGASGSEFGEVTDPVGVFVAGMSQVTASSAGVAVPTSSWRGQTNVSVVRTQPQSTLPNIVGTPMLAQHAAIIRNSQTRRLVTPRGVIKSPDIELATLGTTAGLPQKLNLSLIDFNGANATDPTFFPDIAGSINDLLDNPLQPTFWTFPFASTQVTHSEGTISEQFLFDTGAQVTVLSQQTANDIGFDAFIDVPDFFVEVLGVGGVQQVPGFFMQQLRLNVLGGNIILNDVPVLVLDVPDPRDGIGAVPGILGMNLFSDRDLAINLSRSDPHVRIGAPLVAQWNADANGTWTNDANWILGSPDGVEQPARFMGSITSARTVTLDDAVTVGSLVFDNAHRYTIAGTGEITLNQIAREGSIHVVNGSHRVEVAVGLEVSSELRVETAAAIEFASLWTNRTVTKTGPGVVTFERAGIGTLDVQEGAVRVSGGAARLDVLALNVTGTGLVDLGAAGALVVDYSTSSAYAAVLALVASDKLVTTAPGLVVGLAEISEVASSWPGADASSVVALATRAGDADLDRSVDFDDLLRLAQAYELPGGRWARGDFNYDGLVDFDDLLALAQNYGLSALQGSAVASASQFQSDWALARSLVPEPGSLALLLSAVMFLRRRV